MHEPGGTTGRLLGSSAVEQQEYTTPLYVKGKMQVLPETVPAICGQGDVGAGVVEIVVVGIVVGKTWWRKERKI